MSFLRATCKKFKSVPVVAPVKTVETEQNITHSPLTPSSKHRSVISSKQKKAEFVLTAAAGTLELVDSVADTVPFLSVATGTVRTIINKLLAIRQNKEECNATAQRILDVFLTIADTFRNVDPNNIPPETSRNVGMLQSRLNEFLALVNKIASRPQWKRYLSPEQIKSELSDLNRELDRSLHLSHFSATLSIQCQTERFSGTAQISDDNAPEIDVIKRKDFELGNITLSSSGVVDIYEGTFEDKVIAIKCFKGSNAKSNWARHLAKERQTITPSIVKVIGKSPASESAPYIIYGGIKGNAEERLAALLTSDVDAIVGACISFIYGLSAGLLYFDEQNIPLTMLGAENIHAFLGSGGGTVLCIDWSEVKDDIISPGPCTLLDILDDIASRVYQMANRICYDDSTHAQVSESTDAIELIEAASNPHGRIESNIANFDAPDPERGLVWKKSELDGIFDLASVHDKAMLLHQRGQRGFPLTTSRRYRDIGQLDRQHHTREEVTFSAHIDDYKIISRIIRQEQMDEGQQMVEERQIVEERQTDEERQTPKERQAATEQQTDEGRQAPKEQQSRLELRTVTGTTYRTNLNSWAAQAGSHVVFSNPVASGPQYNQTWSITVYVNNVSAGSGVGTSIGAAKEAAARNACVNLGI